MIGSRKRFFSLIVFLLASAVAELAGRFLLPHEPDLLVPSANPRLIYELNPAYPEINSQRMRDAEIDLATLHERFVIAAIGDSHTYSLSSLRAANGFPARLEAHLNERLGGPRVRVLNFGVPGYNTVQELEVLRSKALPWAPDLVILQYCVNDDHISNYIQPAHPRLNRALHASVLLSSAWTSFLYAEFNRTRLLPAVEDHAPDLLLFSPGLVGTTVSRESGPHGPPHPTRNPDLVPPRYRDVVGRDHLEKAVRAFGAIGRQRRIPMLATGFIEPGDAALYRESGFDVHSFLEIFDGLDMRDYGYDPARTVTHFSDRGNERIGRALAEYLADRVGLGPR